MPMTTPETATIAGTFDHDGRPTIKATLYLPNSTAPIEITLTISTGACQTRISALDWQQTDFSMTEHRWRKWTTGDNHPSKTNEVSATLAMSDTDGKRHYRTMQVILLDQGEAPRSIAGTDLLANTVLTINAQAGILTLEMPELGLPLSSCKNEAP